MDFDMINNITFPDGITWELAYITGADFLGGGISLDSGNLLYIYANNNIVRVGFDTSNITNANAMFENCALSSVNLFDTSNVTYMSCMFNNCTNLLDVPAFDTSKVTTMNRMFQNCEVLSTIPLLDTSSVTNMYRMFYDCIKLSSVPALDMSNVTSIDSMFGNCTSLKSIPDLNISKVTSFGGSSSGSWLANLRNIESIGVLDCDSISNVNYGLGGYRQTYLKHLGGFRNLGKASTVSNTNTNYFLDMAPNLTYESVMNVINLLYDRAAAGLSVLTLKLHPNHLAMLSEDDIAIATNKGWTLV